MTLTFAEWVEAKELVEGPIAEYVGKKINEFLLENDMGCCNIGKPKGCCGGCGSKSPSRNTNSATVVPIVTLKQLQERQSALLAMRKKLGK